MHIYIHIHIYSNMHWHVLCKFQKKVHKKTSTQYFYYPHHRLWHLKLYLKQRWVCWWCTCCLLIIDCVILIWVSEYGFVDESAAIQSRWSPLLKSRVAAAFFQITLVCRERLNRQEKGATTHERIDLLHLSQQIFECPDYAVLPRPQTPGLGGGKREGVLV